MFSRTKWCKQLWDLHKPLQQQHGTSYKLVIKETHGTPALMCRLMMNNSIVDHSSTKRSAQTLIQSHHPQRRPCKEVFNCTHMDASTCASAIQWCGDAQALSHGNIIHGHIVDAGLLRQHAHLESFLINMYVKCGSVDDAISIFSHMHHPCVFAFNYIIRVNAKQGQTHEALLLFNQMLKSGVLPNQVTYTSILSLYVHRQALNHLHISILHSDFSVDIIVATALVNMYGKCGSLKDAERAFDMMPERNLVTWTTMITLYAEHGKRRKAFQTLAQLMHEGFVANRVSFISILAACGDPLALSNGRRVHTTILSNATKLDISIRNALINMYGRCDSLEEAREVFDEMSKRDVISWSAMIAFYAQKAKVREALELFKKMQQSGVKPNKVTFINILAAFSSQTTLTVGRQMHKQIQDYGFELNDAVANALVTMYGKCGSLEDAQKMFQKIPNKDVVSWNSIIGAYAEQGKIKRALRLFEEMQKKGINPDIFTFISLLTAFASLQALAEGRQLHACIYESGLEEGLDVGGALINMYGKCGGLEDAWKVFDGMPERNVVSWNCVIGVHAQHGKVKGALELFYKMQGERIMPDKVTLVSILSACTSPEALPEGKKLHKFLFDNGYKADEVIGSALINMYGKCGSLADAREVFDNMLMPKVVSWTAMMRVYVEHAQDNEALQLFGQMLGKEVLPDKVAFITILAACASQTSLADGKRLHACILDSSLELVVDVGNAIINMYGKCGSVRDAWIVFSKMPELDIVSWNSMLAVYAHHGFGKKVLELFKVMKGEGVWPDKLTFTSVLTACSHAGLVHEGRKYFASMAEDYSMSPDVDHYICMIDLLGRAGLLDEAEHLIQDMPFRPTAVPLMALLGACQCEVDVARGERVANSVIELDPKSATPYVMLSNMYAALGREDDAAKMMQRMRNRIRG